MPKILENVREMLLLEARKQIEENGYSNVTVRTVASACGVGIGTVYNYFPSKDMLVATFMAQDWNIVMQKITSFCDSADVPRDVLECIYRNLKEYLLQYKDMFEDPGAIKTFSSANAGRHKMLRSQLAGPIHQTLVKEGISDDGFMADFMAEALLTWTVEGKAFEEIAEILLKLYKK